MTIRSLPSRHGSAKRGPTKARSASAETVRYFAVDGLKQATAGATVSSTARRWCARVLDAQTACETLMQAANDVTIAAYRHTAPRTEAGMTPAQIGATWSTQRVRSGDKSEFEPIPARRRSAYPHGSGQAAGNAQSGEVVLMDRGGATIHGYQSDISRSFAYGSFKSAPAAGVGPDARDRMSPLPQSSA
ncbi:M24 family metallopeptidase [Sphingopyxis sp.]|uniref:M24 family metallopeptidase n=1 Tax=Sphingopyxis sp. TaxID=1908224 RepID=UPI0025EDBB94|nr:M24 family metallopeptidase [Sphingopyxis sp.]